MMYAETMRVFPEVRPLVAAATLIGIGMGGFVDGILLHQILQVHHMFSARIPIDSLVHEQINMVWDGVFHAFTWIMTALGIGMLWKAGQNPAVPWATRVMIGGLIQGWGWFNLVEGLIDHNLMGLHHVIERMGLSVADYLFLLSGILLIAIGQYLIRSGQRAIGPSVSSPSRHHATL